MAQSIASPAPPVHDDSGRRAMKWSKTYPGIAVEVILGTESQITPQQIETVLRKDFSEAGVDTVVFFYRQNDRPSTIVVYYYSGATDGPFLLNAARPEALESANQYLFQQRNPALAYEYPD
ncbi:MAG: hypothetical protein AAF986_08335 [Pseudomonadota bacterium]